MDGRAEADRTARGGLIPEREAGGDDRPAQDRARGSRPAPALATKGTARAVPSQHGLQALRQRVCEERRWSSGFFSWPGGKQLLSRFSRPAGHAIDPLPRPGRGGGSRAGAARAAPGGRRTGRASGARGRARSGAGARGGAAPVVVLVLVPAPVVAEVPEGLVVGVTGAVDWAIAPPASRPATRTESSLLINTPVECIAFGDRRTFRGRGHAMWDSIDERSGTCPAHGREISLRNRTAGR